MTTIKSAVRQKTKGRSLSSTHLLRFLVIGPPLVLRVHSVLQVKDVLAGKSRASSFTHKNSAADAGKSGS